MILPHFWDVNHQVGLRRGQGRRGGRVGCCGGRQRPLGRVVVFHLLHVVERGDLKYLLDTIFYFVKTLTMTRISPNRNKQFTLLKMLFNCDQM